MARKVITIVIASAAICGGFASTAFAGSPIRLYLGEGAAFSILGHSCGGIQQQVYATGFATNGYPMGSVSMSTRCGGSGRGGGGSSTTYTGTANVVWTWFGETLSYTSPAGSLEAKSAEDGHGDRVYNIGAAAYLETGEPPFEPPAAPTNITAGVGLYEEGESEFLRMNVGWTVAPATAGLIRSSTVTATPVNSNAPVLSTSVIPYFSEAHLNHVEPNTTYRVTVTNTDSEGTSVPSAPIELTTPNSDGEAEREHKNVDACEQDVGTIKLTPGLTETPQVQSITVKGSLKECGGPFEPESGTYVAQLRTTEAVTCSVLSSPLTEPNTTPVSLSVKWLPSEAGKSKGLLSLPLSEVGFTGVTGTLQGGPFASPTGFKAVALGESFTGGSTCGQAIGRKTPKPVKSGSFSTSEVEFG